MHRMRFRHCGFRVHWNCWNHVVDPDDFITHTFQMSEIEKMFLKARDSGEDVIKMIMVKSPDEMKVVSNNDAVV